MFLIIISSKVDISVCMNTFIVESLRFRAIKFVNIIYDNCMQQKSVLEFCHAPFHCFKTIIFGVYNKYYP